MFSRRRKRRNRGIVLLIALGMLGLFSVLIVSYVVFSSQQSQIAISASQQRAENIDPKPILESVLTSIVAGDQNPDSPAFRHDLLGDLWGTDQLRLRVAHSRFGVTPVGGTLNERGRLMRPMLPNMTDPPSTLFKFPIHLVAWHRDGSNVDPVAFELAGDAVLPLARFIPTTANEFAQPNWELILRSRNLPDYRLNDVFAGRLITFLEGPLANVTFRVVRSFGTVPPSNSPVDVGLAGCLVIDLAEMGTDQVEFNGVKYNLYRLATNNPNALLYGPGPDQLYTGVTPGEPLSDDVGYPILMNGVPFNGRGGNPSGANVVSIPEASNPSNGNIDRVFDFQFGPDLLANQKITGLSRQAAVAEPDEPYDAADFDNWFLAWQPSDHRGILPSVAAATGVSPNAAPTIVPSYHRPSVINYLMHAPIWYDENNDAVRQPSEFKRYDQLVGSNPTDAQRLRILFQRVRAACFRPLNFSHAFFGSGVATDLNVDGDPFDGAPGFSGSNATQILNVPIDTQNFAAAYNSLGLLATWLVNGPWDVDNDGDGVNDSLWIDFDLPEQTLADGTVVRPLIAPLIEDLDGRINLNRHGTWAQLTSARFNTANPTSYARAAGAGGPDSGYFAAANGLRIFGRGGGIGPAEINFSHLFDEYRTGSITQPLFYTQTSPPNTNVLVTRYGNLLQSRYGGSPYDYQSPIAQFPVAMPGEDAGPPGQLLFSDPLSRLIHPMRRDFHQFNAPMGRPLDMHGRSAVRKDQAGNVFDDFVGAVVPKPQYANANVTISEVINQPYEFEVDQPIDDDQPFTAAEFYSLVKRGTANAVSQRLVELLGDIADRNEAIDRLVSFDSRSLDVIELPGGQSIVQFVISRLPANIRQNNPAEINEQIERVIAVELRKGSRLNLNRPLSNGIDDTGLLTDETGETLQANPDAQVTSATTIPANTRIERAFPQLQNPVVTDFNAQSLMLADYLPIDTAVDGAQGVAELPSLSAGELLARNLYFLMFRLILDPEVNPAANPTPLLVPNFPYPPGMTDDAADNELRNRYVARRLAQWAVNAVDIRDTNAIMTRLRYDPNPFDNDGFNLDPNSETVQNVVWGLERRELELTETISFHDRRAKRNLATLQEDPALYNDRDVDTDGEYQGDEAAEMDDTIESDQDLDQFRIPEATSVVELHSLRSPYNVVAATREEESYPPELYEFSGNVPRLDLGRLTPRNNNNEPQSPVWRMAVGYTDRSGGDAHRRSALWVNEAERMSTLPTGNQIPDPLLGLNGAGNDHTPGDPNSEWAERIRHIADVTQPFNRNDLVFLFDDDLDPTNNIGSTEQIKLSRFVWFTNTPPDAAAFQTMIDPIATPTPRSGMQINNVFFRAGVRDTVNAPNPAATGGFENVLPYLEGGQYAVVMPRSSTILGSTEESIESNLWPYRPSPQRLEFFGELLGGNTNAYELRYIDLGGDRGSPRSQPRGGVYRTKTVVPIVAAQLRPWQIAGARTDWADYDDINGAPTGIQALNAVQRVRIGFNISAPLSGLNYYDAPTHFINSGGTNAADAYPFCDGYHDYENDRGLHADQPFDQRPGAPLLQNGWVGAGNYQDVATLFLQRLADPTQPWDVTHNPYITVDYLTMDLTVFSGDEDLDQLIDRDGLGNPEPVDLPFTLAPMPDRMAFDTRRKIPDSSRERPLSVLVPRNLGGDLADMTNYDRILYAQRSPLMSLQSVLRNMQRDDTSFAPGVQPYFRFDMVSAWDNDAPSNETDQLNTNFYHQRYTNPLLPDRLDRFDSVALTFPQTLGFLNREFGEPAPARTFFAGANLSNANVLDDDGFYVGYPIAVSLLMPAHSNRPFRSPYELAMVPATSASRLNVEFGPGTNYTSPPHIEAPSFYPHLLGFERQIGDFDANDAANLGILPGPTVNANTSAGFEQLTGKRAGLEQIFDLVDTGPISFGQRRWIDPIQLRTIGNTPTLQTPASTDPVLDGMYTRVIRTLQPPFNYIDRHRTEGKINLNTMPDYIRHGMLYTNFFPPNSFDFQRPLDAGERPDAPGVGGTISGIGADPTNRLAGTATDPINSSILYGNGSVYRALAWGHSHAYELDNVAGEPLVMGQDNRYKTAVDSRFGMGFKAFIESRRGYATSYMNGNLAWSGLHFRNIDLDFRYPSRFAGMFAPAAASTLPSVQKYLRSGGYNPTMSMLRRTHDMSLLRPHPDFDLRLMDDDDADDAAFEFSDDNGEARNNRAYMLGVENTVQNTPPHQVNLPPLQYIQNANGNPASTVVPTNNEPGTLAYNLTNTGLFERPQAELHSNLRELSRDAQFRFQNAARLANLTTHHSNVFMVRFTIGYFQVDPVTGALDQEYLDPREGYERPRGFYLIDRSIPVAYEPGKEHNALNTVLFSSIEE